MTRQYRFVVHCVEGNGGKMRTSAVDSAETPRAALKKLRDYQREHKVADKRLGIYDRKRKRWHDMPSVLR